MKLHVLQKLLPHSCEAGFTIVESLVALLVTAILLAAIAPVLVLSTATRVQSRRVELATLAAQTYIDGIRTGAVDPPSTVIELDPSSDRKLEDNLLNTTNMPIPKESKGLYCYNKSGNIAKPNCTSDLFYIQAAQMKVKGSSPQDGYRLGVRIYRADVDFKKTLIASDGSSEDEKQKKVTAVTFTGGLGNRQAPLIETTTDIINAQTSYSSLCQRLGGCK